jgi:membrane-associated phospholipid phosphatase
MTLSAHTAHFFGLFLPILTLYPKYKWLLILPVFVALSRIIANDHYLSDVAAGIYISILFTWLFVKVFKIK